MKLKLLVILPAVFLSNCTQAQSSFPYERDWGTYVGASGTYLGDFSLIGTSLFKDSQNNIHVTGQTTFESGYSASYFNQFVSGGGNPVVLTGPLNYYSAKFSSAGQMLKGDYNGFNNNFERIVGIDALDNVYTLKNIPAQVANLATPGVWLTQNTNSAGNVTRTLTKRDPNNNVIWVTYLPNNDHNEFLSVRFDSDQNIYLLGDTQYDIPGLGTPGVFQENFVPYSISGIQQNNSYVVKLNSSGQKLWGTFSTPGIFDFKFYNGELYLACNYSPLMPGSFTNPGTFQPDSPAQNIIMKWNADTGKKVWGTFYGTPLNPMMYTGSGISAIEVNAKGIFVSGQNEDEDHSTYFATAGAFKGQMVNGDLFLSKFDVTGNRVWSTYFGSNGYDLINGSDNLTVLDNKIVITGSHYGTSGNVSTPGAFLTTVPNTSANLTNMYFAEFDDNGNRQWSSYYGGAGSNNFGEYINAKFLNNGALILWGLTGSPTGIGTSGAAYPNMINPYPSSPFGFIAKFSSNRELSTSETVKNEDLQLYDNPNNGNFTISGNILEKQKAVLSVFDRSGKLVYQTPFERKKTSHFNLQGKLTVGNYLLEVTADNTMVKVFKMTVKQ
ncbi:T9SS type A sorting domain-containing protein [Chryseobacterium sp. SSA4.19]|uniref:T9SS type A sorting domain-containing protein n=1 Tax=Chryseobacterium sp. SSA4.19 TaxID=2919915 RepID=UPI001F4EE4A1|nr:T9SS type A sorting domain-containing protein [Chryseobacterium sp. SSA4.19]MCJ8155538.1 T9SS type A sorting domain-containing protein [Chryseobacterium sp. SSA4.19]